MILSESSLSLPVKNRIGAVAVKRGLVTKQQLQEAVRIQTASAKAGLRKRIGEILVRKGYLSPRQVNEIMARQSVGQARKQIGSFELLSKLGAGGMGVVFKARQISLNRHVALKILASKFAKKKSFTRQFIQEARSVASLDHPNIVRAIDVGFADDFFFFAMELVDGESLAQKLINLDGPLPEAQALNYLKQICQALQHAHDHGLLHRDVKPDNILVNSKGVAKLADLGLARPVQDPTGPFSADQGMIAGTPHYMAPEQALGHPLSAQTDLYSLGATLYHLITGHPPYDGDDVKTIMVQHCSASVPNPLKRQPNLSPRTADLCTRLMQKDPEDRYANAQEVMAAIEHALLDLQPGTGTKKSAPTPRKVPTRKRRRGRQPSGITAVKRGTKTHKSVRRSKGSSEIGILIGILAIIGLVLLAFAWGLRHG